MLTDRGAGWGSDRDPYLESPSYVPVLPIGPPGRFLTPLTVRVLEERDPSGRELLQLVAPFRYYSPLLDRVIEPPVGLVFDNESVPLSLRSFSGTPSTRGGLIHDYGYLFHDPDDRALWDRIYREAMLTDGVHVVDADKRYGAVSAHGRRAWETGPARRRMLPVA